MNFKCVNSHVLLSNHPIPMVQNTVSTACYIKTDEGTQL